MKRIRKAFVVFVLAAVALAAFAPFALAAKAAPTVSLKATPTSVKVGKTVTFSGTVKHPVAKDTAVVLRLVVAKKTIVKKSATITSKGAFKFTHKATEAGKWTFRVTYKVGKHTYKSNEVRVTVKK